MIRPHPLIPAGAANTVDRLLGRMRLDLCVIERPATTKDPGGAILNGWTVVQGVDCQVAAAGRQAIERIFGGRFGPETEYVLKLPRETQIEADWRVVVNGLTMQITGTDEAKSYGFEKIVAARAAS